MIGKIPAQTAVYNATVKSCCESTQQSRRKLSVSPPRPTVPFNNNNNNHDTYNAVIMTKVIARVHSVNLVNVEQRQAAADPQIKLVVWCSGNALVSINAVALHRARLVLGWVTAFGQVNCLIT